MNKFKIMVLVFLGLFSQQELCAAEKSLSVEDIKTGLELIQKAKITINTQKDFVARVTSSHKEYPVYSYGLIQWFADSSLNKDSYDKGLTEAEKQVIRLVKLVNRMYSAEDAGINVPILLEKMLLGFEDSSLNQTFQKEVALLEAIRQEAESVKTKLAKIEAKEAEQIFCTSYLTKVSDFFEDLLSIASADQEISAYKNLVGDLAVLKKFENKITSASDELLAKCKRIAESTTFQAKNVILEEIKTIQSRVLKIQDEFSSKTQVIHEYLALVFERMKKTKGLDIAGKFLERIEKIIEVCNDKTELIYFIRDTNQRKIKGILGLCRSASKIPLKEVPIDKSSSRPFVQEPKEAKKDQLERISADSSPVTPLIDSVGSESPQVLTITKDFSALDISPAKQQDLQGKSSVDHVNEVQEIHAEVIRRYTDAMANGVKQLESNYLQWVMRFDKIKVVFEGFFGKESVGGNLVWTYRLGDGPKSIQLSKIRKNQRGKNYLTALNCAEDSLRSLKEILSENRIILEGILESARKKKEYIHRHGLDRNIFTCLDDSTDIPDTFRSFGAELREYAIKCAAVVNILNPKSSLLEVTPQDDPQKLISLLSQRRQELSLRKQSLKTSPILPEASNEEYVTAAQEDNTSYDVSSEWPAEWPVDKDLIKQGVGIVSEECDLDYQERVESSADKSLETFDVAKKYFINILRVTEKNLNEEFPLDSSVSFDFKCHTKKDLSYEDLMSIARETAFDHLSLIKKTLTTMTGDFEEGISNCNKIAMALLDRKSDDSRGLYFSEKKDRLKSALDAFYTGPEYTYFLRLKKRIEMIILRAGGCLVPIDPAEYSNQQEIDSRGVLEAGAEGADYGDYDVEYEDFEEDAKLQVTSLEVFSDLKIDALMTKFEEEKIKTFRFCEKNKNYKKSLRSIEELLLIDNNDDSHLISKHGDMQKEAEKIQKLWRKNIEPVWTKLIALWAAIKKVESKCEFELQRKIKMTLEIFEASKEFRILRIMIVMNKRFPGQKSHNKMLFD